MTALLSRRRLDGSAAESVDDLAQVKQIPESAQIVVAIADIFRRRSVGLLGAPIGQLSWNERPAAVRQSHENQEDATPPDAADRHQRLAFESVALADDRHRIRNIMAMGSLAASFGSVDHGWLMRMLAHRIADPRVLRLIERWLGAGVLQSGQWRAMVAGTPQGSGISPILANVFLHYVVDLWVHQWRRPRAAGQVSVCRHADDMVLGCQFEADGKQLLADLKDRLQQFGLSLHEGKTRLSSSGGSPPATEPPLGGDARRRSTFWASRTTAARPERTSSWSSGRRRPRAWSES